MISSNDAINAVAMSAQEGFDINELMSAVVGTTFANMISVTEVALASAHKKAGIVIKKVVQCNIIIANNLQESTNLYKNKVERTVDGDPSEFVFSGSNYTRTGMDAYSVISLKRDVSKKYLEAFPQQVQSVHYVKMHNGAVSSIEKAEVATLVTPSAAKAMFEDKSVVHNKTNDMTHSAIYRAYKLESIHQLKFNGQTYTGQFFAE